MKKIQLALFGVAAVWATSVAADDVVLDDAIISGSLCAGFDCVNGEIFGFDTVRLKENNLRIRFQDTSNSASFPTTDWTLVANDTTNGGRNYFGIENADRGFLPFMVMADANAFALTLNQTGAGFGTETPNRALHVDTADSPTLRLEQNASGGWEPAAWDIGGNESNFFIRNAVTGELPIRVLPNDGPATIALEGQIGVNTEAPLGALHLRSADGAAAYLEDTTSGSTWEQMAGADDSVAGGRMWTLGEVGQPTAMRVTHDGNVEIAGTLVQGSSRSIKHGFTSVDANQILKKVEGLNISQWIYKRDHSGAAHLGPMAEEFHAAFGLGADDKHLAPTDLAGVAVASVQALNQRVQEQDAEIRRLKQEAATLEARFDRLEELLRAR